MKKPKCKGKHAWTYYGGVCKCKTCGWYLHPDGKVTSTPSGRTRKVRAKK